MSQEAAPQQAVAFLRTLADRIEAGRLTDAYNDAWKIEARTGDFEFDVKAEEEEKRHGKVKRYLKIKLEWLEHPSAPFVASAQQTITSQQTQTNSLPAHETPVALETTQKPVLIEAKPNQDA
jgi:hypothetical protein